MCESLHVAVKMYINYGFFIHLYVVLNKLVFSLDLNTDRVSQHL